MDLNFCGGLEETTLAFYLNIYGKQFICLLYYYLLLFINSTILFLDMEFTLIYCKLVKIKLSQNGEITLSFTDVC